MDSQTIYIKQHYGISDGLLARKWGIGQYKANKTLQYTTQYNIISALKLLTWRYKKDFLFQRLSHLNCIFLIETIFATDQDIVVNTCAHILTDVEFVQIIPMRSKSEADTTLDRIN